MVAQLYWNDVLRYYALHALLALRGAPGANETFDEPQDIGQRQGGDESRIRV